jgi:hypothetical protein
MRTRASLAAIAAAVGAWTAGTAWAGGPGDVYNDYVQDGVLSCNHSRADLEAVLRSGSLNQYGDPLTLARLKLAVRKQLAGGCRHVRRPGHVGSGGSAAPAGGGGGGTARGQKPAGKASPRHVRRHRGSGPARPRQAARELHATSGGDNGSFIAGRGLIVGLLVAAVALGGWLTKHALAARD